VLRGTGALVGRSPMAGGGLVPRGPRTLVGSGVDRAPEGGVRGLWPLPLFGCGIDSLVPFNHSHCIHCNCNIFIGVDLVLILVDLVFS
jgi:hypothetical protein